MAVSSDINQAGNANGGRRRGGGRQYDGGSYGDVASRVAGLHWWVRRSINGVAAA